MVNQVIMIGRIGQDPVLRHTPSGAAVVELSVATDKGYGQAKKTFWHSVTFWKESAEKIAHAVRKGDTLFIEGSLEYQEFEKNGQKVKKAAIQGYTWRHLISHGGIQQRATVTTPLEDDVL